MQEVLKRINSLNRREVSQFPSNVEDPVGTDNFWVRISHFHKLAEEFGEVARCINGRNEEPLAAEACDAAICCLAIALLELDGDVSQLSELMMPKLDKWEQRLEETS